MTDNDLPWAQVRLIADWFDSSDPVHQCQMEECESPALLHFRTDALLEGIRIRSESVSPADLLADVVAGEVVSEVQRVDSYACREHAGRAAVWAAFRVAAG